MLLSEEEKSLFSQISLQKMGTCTNPSRLECLRQFYRLIIWHTNRGYRTVISLEVHVSITVKNFPSHVIDPWFNAEQRVGERARPTRLLGQVYDTLYRVNAVKVVL